MFREEHRTSEEIEVFEGSGNVFADLGLPDAEERFDKALISILIRREIESRSLTHERAADLLAISESELAAVSCGELSDFSMDRLFGFVAALGITLTSEAGQRPHFRKQHGER